MLVLRLAAAAVAVVTLAIMLTANQSSAFLVADSVAIVLLGVSVFIDQRWRIPVMTVGFAVASAVFAVALGLSVYDGAANPRVALGLVVTVPALIVLLRSRSHWGPHAA